MEQGEFEILTTEQAARVLGMSQKALENWRLKGQGPTCIRYSRGAVRYRRSDLLAYIEACASSHGKKGKKAVA